MTTPPPSEGASPEEARALAHAVRSLLKWVRAEEMLEHRNEVVGLVLDFLGEDAAGHSVVGRNLPAFEHVNLQTALEAWMGEAGREVAVHGVAMPPHYGEVSLHQIVAGDGLPPIRLSAAPLVDLPDGPGSTLACLLRAVLLVDDDAGRYVVFVNRPGEHDPRIGLEIAGLSVDAAQAVHARLDELRRRLNVYRGHVLDVTILPGGGLSLSFGEVPATERSEVILPEPILGRIERHALSVAAHRRRLLEAGQHLKRGLLLYGPPGTGKTHTTRYLLGRMDGYTRMTLTGRALGAIGPAAELARDLQPAAIVLEDVDLVAEERSHGPASSPILFDLLDAMDGASADADLLFLLTTNRADLLEPALAARPGRVDVAVEIGLPDADGRRRLLTLYGRSVSLRLSEAEFEIVVARTEGVTASFLKELLRRAILESLHEGGTGQTVAAAHLEAALDDLLDSAQGVTRSLLGVGGSAPPASGGGAGSLPPPPRGPRVSVRGRFVG